jgi:hypothetical protein
MDNLITGYFPPMVEKVRRKLIGGLIRQKRKFLNIGQTDLGLKIWDKGRLSKSAMQTKVSRLENGDYWPSKDELIRIIDFLDLWEDIFDLPSHPTEKEQAGFYIDPSWSQYIPNLEMMISLLSDLARKGKADLFYRQLALLCDSATQEYESKYMGKKGENGFL